MKAGEVQSRRSGFSVLFSLSALRLSLSRSRAQHAPHAVPRVPQELSSGRSHFAPASARRTTTRDDDIGRCAALLRPGAAYLHTFVWIEAARSFHQALRLDPDLALAHVGLSYAYIELNKPAEARRAIERARALGAEGVGSRAPAHRGARAADGRGRQPARCRRLTAYRQALDAAIAAFPADVEFLLQARHGGISRSRGSRAGFGRRRPFRFSSGR